ncbi:DVL-like protein [Cynara cardunculus var. scolymus]|uniref:DVL-like protein n=1 Tax=Cynara cardunculus var. scolymus TaxID=59895 RepID=A0A103YD89_CYNCS|nr:DVL-like protein [Cynara cardunculus var. scolymus]
MAARSTTVDAPLRFSCSDDNRRMSKKGSRSSPSHRRCTFTRKCAGLVKEQRARFYIMRRCVSMLVCWRDYRDS